MTEHAITVDVTHVRGLNAYGPGWAIMFDGSAPVIVPTEQGDDGALLEIITYEGLRRMREFLSDEGEPNDDDRIAYDLTVISRDDLDSWDGIEALMPLTMPYTAALAAYGFCRWGQGNTCGGHQIIQPYHTDFSDGGEFKITIPAATDTPVIIERVLRKPGGAYDRTVHVATVPADTPPTDVAALIATAAQIQPADTPVNV